MTLINQATNTTRDLIACHDSDTRYGDLSCRSAVAALYLPIIGLVVGALQQLHGYGSEENSSITPDVAMAIATSSITGVMATEESKGDMASQVCSLILLDHLPSRVVFLKLVVKSYFAFILVSLWFILWLV